jgi:catechol 2,3-dioxygenase-like lactoylglutathione lyase family enzyme
MQSIGALNLLVADYDEAITFYTNQLSFVVREDTTQLDDRRWVVIAPKNSSGMSLILSKAKNALETQSIGCQAGGRVLLFLYTDNFYRDYNDYMGKGVRFTEKPRHEVYGIVAVFEDLYGNKWDLIELNK